MNKINLIIRTNPEIVIEINEDIQPTVLPKPQLEQEIEKPATKNSSTKNTEVGNPDWNRKLLKKSKIRSET